MSPQVESVSMKQKKVIEFNQEKRMREKALEDFKAYIATIKSEEIESAFFYAQSRDALEISFLSALNPDWNLIGRVRGFVSEIEQGLYINDFEEAQNEKPV